MEARNNKTKSPVMANIDNTPAGRILEAIKVLRTTGYQVQKDLNLSRGAVSNWRRGICQPSDKMIDKFCDHYHISRNWILTGIGTMKTFRKAYSASVQDQIRDLRQRIEALEQEVQRLKKKTPGQHQGLTKPN